MEFRTGPKQPDRRRGPGTFAEGAGALGTPFAYPEGAAEDGCSLESHSSGSTAQQGWADSLTVICQNPRVRVNTERRDRRQVDLEVSARECLGGSFAYDAGTDGDMETWLLARTRATRDATPEHHSEVAIVDGTPHPGVIVHHENGLTAWAIDLGDLRIAGSGPTDQIDQLSVSLTRA